MWKSICQKINWLKENNLIDTQTGSQQVKKKRKIRPILTNLCENQNHVILAKIWEQANTSLDLQCTSYRIFSIFITKMPLKSKIKFLRNGRSSLGRYFVKPLTSTGASNWFGNFDTGAGVIVFWVMFVSGKANNLVLKSIYIL
jgi:hypothetical protein